MEYGQSQAQPVVEAGKIFVGGLSWSTTKESLAVHFAQYGEIEKSEVVVDETGDPRGFGFITYKVPESVQIALASGPHKIDGKIVDPKQATVRGGGGGQQSRPAGSVGDAGTIKKIFVGGVAANTTEDDIRQYFTSHISEKGYGGQVLEVELKYDSVTNRMRGFGFVGFDSEETVKDVLQQKYHQICGKSVEVKRAESRNATSKAQQGFGQQQGYAYGSQQQGYGQYGSYGNYYAVAAAAAAAYSNAYSAQYASQYANQQASATPQQMGGGAYGQDSAVARGTGYNTSTAGYSQFPQGTSTYNQSQNPAANVAAYQQQQSYPAANQTAATYSNQSAAGQGQYYKGY